MSSVGVPARLERRRTSKGQLQFYLAKDVRIGTKKAKVTKYLGTEEPSLEELENALIAAAYELEHKAMEKRAELSASRYPPHPFFPEDGKVVILILERFRFLHRSLQENLRANELRETEESLEHRYVNGSTGIEGNTLTLQETRLLLQEGIVPAGRSLREINEVQNFKAVRSFREGHRGRITLFTIKKIHSLMMANIDPSAGILRRTDDIDIVGRDLLLTPSVMIEEELSSALNQYYDSLERGTHPFFSAVLFHHRFESVHPFADGNGRVGRELFNMMLTVKGYPRFPFLAQDRPRYLMALALGDEGRPTDMIETFVRMIVSQRMDVVEERLRRLIGPEANKDDE
ncbi:MAG: Fic family protein [Euryarchaeota archaeon]|nr:Fic family protein [Euryarchaeota archaeon]